MENTSPWVTTRRSLVDLYEQVITKNDELVYNNIFGFTINNSRSLKRKKYVCTTSKKTIDGPKSVSRVTHKAS